MDLALAVPLAAGSAALYGTADFLGGVAARRASGLTAAAGAQSFGLVAALAAGVLGGGHPTAADLAWGGVSGLCGGLGLALFFQALKQGRMSTVAPITAVTCAVVPISSGLLAGERPSALAAGGIALAAVAIALVSREPAKEGDDACEHAPDRTSILLSLLAGLFFGGFYAAIAHTGHGAGLWPIVANRVCSVLVLWVLMLAGGKARLAELRTPGFAGAAAASGVIDIAANSLYLVSSRSAPLSLVGTIASLYPASTVLLAVVVLKERLDRAQQVGLLATAGAIVLIATG